MKNDTPLLKVRQKCKREHLLWAQISHFMDRFLYKFISMFQSEKAVNYNKLLKFLQYKEDLKSDHNKI